MICKVISKDRSYHDVQINHKSKSKDEAMVKIIKRKRKKKTWIHTIPKY